MVWRISVGVCFFVVIMREVVECLEGLRGVVLVGDAMLASAVQVFECMDCGFVVLFAWIGAV